LSPRPLLLVRGEVNEAIGFDRTGVSHKAPSSHEWYRMASARLDGGAGDSAPADPRTMLVGVPTRRAMALSLSAYVRRSLPT
jgi:hypothetical protein